VRFDFYSLCFILIHNTSADIHLMIITTRMMEKLVMGFIVIDDDGKEF